MSFPAPTKTAAPAAAAAEAADAATQPRQHRPRRHAAAPAAAEAADAAIQHRPRRPHCQDGPSCPGLAAGRCPYFHRKSDTQCYFGGDCTKRHSGCPFGHPESESESESEPERESKSKPERESKTKSKPTPEPKLEPKWSDESDDAHRARPATGPRVRHARAESPASAPAKGCIFCTKCGKKAGTNDKFCGGCGTRLN